MFFVWLLLYETAVMHVHIERESKSEHKAEGVGEEEAAGGWGGGGGAETMATCKSGNVQRKIPETKSSGKLD